MSAHTRTIFFADASLAQIDLLQVGAIVLLVLAAGALTAAILAARREGRGVASIFGLADKSSSSRGPVGSDELRALMDQADELAEGLATDLDNRAAKLETLISEADDRLARLERANNAANPPLANGMIEPAAPHPQSREDPITREIYRLSDTGLPSVEIAKRLSQHTGKVELISRCGSHE